MNLADKEALQEQLRKARDEPVVTASGWPEATLVYGYTVARDTFHVYKRDGLLHRVVYRQHWDGTIEVIEYAKASEFLAKEMTPSKGIYWPHSDYAFVSACARLGAYVHLKDSTTEPVRPYHGHVVQN